MGITWVRRLGFLINFPDDGKAPYSGSHPFVIGKIPFHKQTSQVAARGRPSPWVDPLLENRDSKKRKIWWADRFRERGRGMNKSNYSEKQMATALQQAEARTAMTQVLMMTIFFRKK